MARPVIGSDGHRSMEVLVNYHGASRSLGAWGQKAT